MIRNRLYRKGVLESSDFDEKMISDFLDEPDTMVWLDLAEPGMQDFTLLAEEFGLHELAVEDATKPYQRPKVEVYSDHHFIVMYALDQKDGELSQAEIDVFIGQRFIITVRKDPVWEMGRVIERWDAEEDISEQGVGYLLYALMDVVVDDYLVLADRINDDLEDLQEELFSGVVHPDIQRRIFEMRKKLVAFNRHALPMREVINALLRRDSGKFSNEIRPYFQDVYDHVIRVESLIDSMRELLSSAYEVHLSLTSNRLNDIMKKVTSWAAILGVATVIAGIYGMNFELYPNDGMVSGFWFAVGVMATGCLGLYALFKKKDWL